MDVHIPEELPSHQALTNQHAYRKNKPSESENECCFFLGCQRAKHCASAFRRLSTKHVPARDGHVGCVASIAFAPALQPWDRSEAFSEHVLILVQKGPGILHWCPVEDAERIDML